MIFQLNNSNVHGRNEMDTQVVVKTGLQNVQWTPKYSSKWVYETCNRYQTAGTLSSAGWCRLVKNQKLGVSVQELGTLIFQVRLDLPLCRAAIL